MQPPPICAQMEIVLRNGNVINLGFSDDEAVNAVVERIKRTIGDEKGVLSIDMLSQATLPPSNVTHYIPSREVVRVSVGLIPRPHAIVP